MVMETLQIRLTKKLVKETDAIVKEGRYTSRADVIREALRDFLFDLKLRHLQGMAKKTTRKSGVEQVRALRGKMTAEDFPIEEMNQTLRGAQRRRPR